MNRDLILFYFSLCSRNKWSEWMEVSCWLNINERNKRRVFFWWETFNYWWIACLFYRLKEEFFYCLMDVHDDRAPFENLMSLQKKAFWSFLKIYWFSFLFIKAIILWKFTRCLLLCILFGGFNSFLIQNFWGRNSRENGCEDNEILINWMLKRKWISISKSFNGN